MNEMFFEEPIAELEPARGGYLRHKKTKRLWHRIVCEKYHGAFPSTWVVHHLDGNKKEPCSIEQDSLFSF